MDYSFLYNISVNDLKKLIYLSKNKLEHLKNR